jgi:VanZ family protein
LIFGVVGLAFGLGYRFGHLYQMIGMVVFAGAIELAQYLVADRHARMSDFIVDATSACIAGVVGWLAHKTISRWRKPKGRTALT